MRVSKFLQGTCSVALMISWFTGEAQAQAEGSLPRSSAPHTSAAPTAPANAADQGIIVTARRRDERLQDVPVAISAFGAKELARYQTNSVSDIASQTPQLVISQPSGPGGSNINLRGVGSVSSSPSVDQAVSINIDGIQVSQANFLALGTYDLDHVEVLKGPQALFFGKNSPAGVISLVSVDPGKAFEWRLRSSYDFNNKGELVEAMVSTPLTDKLGLRVDGAFKDQDGWFQNIPVPSGVTVSDKTGPQATEYFVRGTLKYGDKSDAFNANLKASYGSIDRNGAFANYQLYSCPGGKPAVPGYSSDCKLDRYFSEPNLTPAEAATDPSFYGNGTPFFKDRLLLTSLTMNWRPAEHLTLTSVTGYLRLREKFSANFNENGFSQIITGTDQTQRQFTQELRLASSFDSPINFTLGSFYQNAHLSLRIPATLPAALSPTGAPLLIADDSYALATHAWSVFGQTIWKFADRWELAGGARYSHEEKAEQVHSNLYKANYAFLNPDRTFNNVSPEATLSFRPSRNLTLYGAYRQGFTSGGFNQTPLAYSLTATNDNSFKQSTVRGGEIGVKGSAAHHQISFDFTAYKYDYKNLQLQVLDSTTLSLTLKNAGSATVQGLEFSTTIQPDALRGLSLRSSAAYNDAHYTSFTDAPCYTGQTIALGCSGTVIGGAATTQNLTGSHLERAPVWSLNEGFTYDRPLSDSLSLGVSGDTYYSSSYFSDTEHDPRAVQAGAWRLNAALTLRGRNDGWEVSLIGKNLTNVLRAEFSAGAPFSGSGTGTSGPAMGADIEGVVSAPRTVVLQLTLKNSLFQ